MQKAQEAIEKEVQAVLDARTQFAASSLADLYDPLTMPPALLKAHQRLDAAVDKAHQLAGGPRAYANDAARVAFLFTLYQRITSLLPAAVSPYPYGKKSCGITGSIYNFFSSFQLKRVE